jgi:LPXTG-motif cell wall-anchored protein
MALLAGAFLPPAKADAFDKKTIVTFSTPVEIPGKVLLPGTYVFKLLDSTSNRNIVQIFNKDEDQLYATILAIPDYRMKPTDKPLITFEERASGAPPAIKAWFYPGDEYGAQFVYPRTRATELAQRTNQNVLSMPNEMAQHITTPAKSASEPSVQAMQHTDVTAVKPNGDEVALAVVIIAEKPQDSGTSAAANSAASSSTSSGSNATATAAQTETHAPAHLPKTAGDLPLFSVLGACSLGLGLLVSLLRRRR